MMLTTISVIVGTILMLPGFIIGIFGPGFATGPNELFGTHGVAIGTIITFLYAGLIRYLVKNSPYKRKHYTLIGLVIILYIIEYGFIVPTVRECINSSGTQMCGYEELIIVTVGSAIIWIQLISAGCIFFKISKNK